jgi:iron complex transport system ATP-binding protein
VSEAPRTGAEAIVFDAVEVSVGGRTILGPVDLRIRTGERWAVLGPNGSGKTTLLSVAGARRRPSCGRAVVLGEQLGRADVRQLRKRIGHVSHAVADRIRPTLPVVDVVLTGKASVLETWWQDLTGDDRNAAITALRDVGCDALAQRPLETCSLGERQRVLIARALFGAHPLLLFDEPAAGLDLPAREQLLSAMTKTSDGIRTTVLATHHLEEIPEDATNAALMRGGRVVAAGPVGEILADAPLSECFGIDVAVTRTAGRWAARAGGFSHR